MAKILNTQTNSEITLVVYHTFGRHPMSNNTILSNADASRFHAAIHWDGEGWQLKGKSINGTYINGIRVAEESNNLLKKGDAIHFGNLQSDMWKIIAIDAPESMLIPLTDELETIVLDGVIVLPSKESPQISLYLSSDGQWMCESEAGTNHLKAGDLVGIEDKVWRFVDAEPTTSTQVVDENKTMPPPEVSFHFNVSQNEEHISLKLKIGQQLIDLKERTHHYLLLLLARQRLDDNAKAVIKSEQGWIDKGIFSDMLGMDDNHVNILIYRFRKQCLAALPQSMGLHQLIERRAGELRLNCDIIQIEGGLPNHESSASHQTS